MKKIFNISLAALLLLVTSSCSDFLDQPALGQENLDTYFQNEDECLKQITGCYQSIFYDDWWQVQRFYLMGDVCSDDMWMGNTTQDPGDWRDLAHYTGNGNTDATQNFWQYRFKGILRCNVALARIPGAPISNTTLKSRMLAEAKFLRAFQYFDLVKNFGGLPLITSVIMPNDAVGLKRASQAETYAMIEKDLREAIPDLPLRSAYAATDMGRVTKGAAQGILAKVYLYQDKYASADSLLRQVIDSKEYELLDDFGKVWDMHYNNSKESLFEVQTNSDISYNLGERMSVVCGSRDDSGWSWGLPTSDLENAFKNAGDEIRLKWTIIKDSATVIPGEPKCTAANPYIISASKHKSGRVTRKLYIPVADRPSPYDANHIPLNYRLLRYADILLMYAETENQLGRDDVARTYLNMVRKRVNLSEVTASGKQLRDAIRLERRLELALEDQRMYDLRRWTDDNGKKAIENIMGPNGSFVIYNTQKSTDKYELGNQIERSDKGINFQSPRDLLFPIPHSDITQSNGSIEQNPGY
jgi:hypothetical protein